MMNISMGKLICKMKHSVPMLIIQNTLPRSLSLSHTHIHMRTCTHTHTHIHSAIINMNSIIFIPIKIHVMECYFLGSTLVTNGKHHKPTIKNNNNINNNNTPQIGMPFLFLIIIQCYVSGKPLILIINTFLKFYCDTLRVCLSSQFLSWNLFK